MTTIDRAPVIGTMYLIHFDRPIGGDGRNSASHYLGWAEGDSVDARIAKHQAGSGARILAYLVRMGIEFEVVATWPGDRNLERRWKNNGHHDRRCPVCRANQVLATADERASVVA